MGSTNPYDHQKTRKRITPVTERVPLRNFAFNNVFIHIIRICYMLRSTWILPAYLMSNNYTSNTFTNLFSYKCIHTSYYSSMTMLKTSRNWEIRNLHFAFCHYIGLDICFMKISPRHLKIRSHWKLFFLIKCFYVVSHEFWRWYNNNIARGFKIRTSINRHSGECLINIPIIM